MFTTTAGERLGDDFEGEVMGRVFDGGNSTLTMCKVNESHIAN